MATFLSEEEFQLLSESAIHIDFGENLPKFNLYKK